MSTVASAMLRSHLLDEVSILVVGAPAASAGEGMAESSAPVGRDVDELFVSVGGMDRSFARAVVETCQWLGACAHLYASESTVDEAAMDAAVTSALAATAPVATAGDSSRASSTERCAIDVLVVDGAGLFASGGLRACLDSAWDATRAVVNLAFLPAGGGGRVVYLAPAPGAGEQADAARAGLENLARTLSIEWARHEITLVAVALGDATTPGEAAALVAYLASPAGAYFSGCLLDLRGV